MLTVGAARAAVVDRRSPQVKAKSTLTRSTLVRLVAPVAVLVTNVVLAVLLLSPWPRIPTEGNTRVHIDHDEPECTCRDVIRGFEEQLDDFELPEDHSPEHQEVLIAFQRSLLCGYFIADDELAKSVRELNVSAVGVDGYITSRTRIPESMLPKGGYERRVVEMLRLLKVAVEQTETACDARQGPREVG